MTLGARSVAVLRGFYGAWGWVENDGSSDDYASFAAGSVRVALYPMDLLRDEAAPGERIPAEGEWNGITLAINLADRFEVDRVVSDAVDVGAALVQAPRSREWGGYSGYVSDPEGNRWELAWAPGFDPS